MNKEAMLNFLLSQESDGVVDGVITQMQSAQIQLVKKALLSLATNGYIELSSELEVTGIGMKINCRLTEKALRLKRKNYLT
ncbi:MAG: hypothetical protein A4E53_02950 [Pelotomaculum sp. PtaB.Bin104]|nr:MAG: hypothetical protein A4E53_02950 [Pelotomaculum sp. PtaB.Bin104]